MMTCKKVKMVKMAFYFFVIPWLVLVITDFHTIVTIIYILIVKKFYNVLERLILIGYSGSIGLSD